MHTTVEFALGRDDFTRFQRLSSRLLTASGADVRAMNAIPRIVVWMLLASSLFIAFRSAGSHPSESGMFHVLAVTIGAAVFVAFMAPHLVAARLRRRVIVDNGAFLRPHALTFTADSIAVTWRAGRSEQSWDNVLFRANDPVNHYLYLDGCAAIIVPRHVVAPFEADFERYIAAIPAA
jgi:hypothetical protein